MKGATFKLGNREFTVPPLTLGQLREFMPLMTSMAAVSPGSVEQWDTMIAAMVAALRTQSPPITREELIELSIGVDDLPAALVSIGRAAGIKERDGAPGEATAGA